MTTTEMKKFFELCREFGVSKIRTKGMFVVFGEKDNRFTFVSEKTKEPVESEREPTEDELLMWSTPHYDEIRESRKAALK